MLKFALLGRKGSGRAYFQKLLKKEGLKIAKSYTTREQKDENDNMHHFIDSIENYDNRILETRHDGYEYFYIRSELENADMILSIFLDRFYSNKVKASRIRLG